MSEHVCTLLTLMGAIMERSSKQNDPARSFLRSLPFEESFHTLTCRGSTSNSARLSLLDLTRRGKEQLVMSQCMSVCVCVKKALGANEK